MLTALLQFQVGYLTRSKEFTSDDRCVVAVSCPYDVKRRGVVRLCRDAFVLRLLCEILLILSGDVEVNPGPSPSAELLPILEAIKRIENVQATIRVDLEQIKSTQTAQQNLITEILSRSNTLDSCERNQSISTAANTINRLEHAITTLKAANIDTNNRMRRDNLLFFGIDDSDKEPWSDSENKILDLCKNTLDLTLSASDIERAHRLGKFSATKKRPIIVKLAHFKTKENILACGRKLKDTCFAIREDFAPSTRLARSKLLKFVKPQKCAFKLSLDKLHVGSRCYSYDAASDSVIEHTTATNSNTLAAPRDTLSDQPH